MAKVNFVFDATSLSSGANKGCFRSGIYFAAMNILKALSKREDLNISLYCNYKELAKLYITLENDFKDYKLDIISDVPMNSLTKFYNYCLKKRTISKNNKENFAKFLWDIMVRILKPILKVQYLLFRGSLLKYEKEIDVFFSPQTKIPYPFNRMQIKKAIFLHDAIPLVLPEYHPYSKKGSWYSQLIETINNEDYYFTNSEYTRQDFLKYFPVINEEKIKTALLACSDIFKPSNFEQIKNAKIKYGIPENINYIFSLCTLEPRKNLLRTIKTFVEFIKKNNINDLYFVLGGGQWKKFISILESEIHDLGQYEDKILKIGYVDDEDLPALYSGAEWFVYTSQYEGFGLPPLEAMSCGCPVITSDNSSLPEVVDSAGIMIKWDSDREHIEAYEKYYYNQNLRDEYSQKGLENAKRFSWERCANTIVEKFIS